MQLFKIVLFVNLLSLSVYGNETFQPYKTTDDVPQNAVELWKSYDARAEPLDVRVIKEWKTDGVVTRYVTFRVGTFKESESRIAAYYSFPANNRKNAGFVWSHGGGQRAERNRGRYFATQGFATVDINWLGRPMESDIDVNTNWGNVDPTQGPRFYSKALRDGWKRNLQPDEFSIDPVPSPRNANWFLLAVAARRAITFLEQQPEVDASKLGFSGFSMGGMITALTAADARLKAVVPFVGGTAFKHIDFPGDVRGSSIRAHFKDTDLYSKTIDASAYWPFVKCPVMFISSSNDFHSAFDRIYQSMGLVKHPHWRVSTNMHQNHGPGPEQWVLLNQWFDQYLKGLDQKIPITPPSTFTVKDGMASFTVTPEDSGRLLETEVYFSYDPNSRTRFWNRANAQRNENTWSAQVPVHKNLPLYMFALCRYRLDAPVQLEREQTSTLSLNSWEHSLIPETVDLQQLSQLPKTRVIFEDFKQGTQDWSSRDQRSITTYKFQTPDLDRSDRNQLSIKINPAGKRLSLRLNAGSKFLSQENNLGDFVYVKSIEPGQPQQIVISRNEFKNPDGKTLEWSKVATFEITLIDRDTNQKVMLTSEAGQKHIEFIKLENGTNQ
ncbi:MAG TPA: hypothetical protein DEF45_12790 [Rhodopirellula sp.]|nr:hypothetical protein [Rhodopirellula sp.]